MDVHVSSRNVNQSVAIKVNQCNAKVCFESLQLKLSALIISNASTGYSDSDSELDSSVSLHEASFTLSPQNLDDDVSLLFVKG